MSRTTTFTTGQLISLKDFFNSNKNAYLFSNAYNVEAIVIKEQTITFAIFALSIIAVLNFICLVE